MFQVRRVQPIHRGAQWDHHQLQRYQGVFGEEGVRVRVGHRHRGHGQDDRAPPRGEPTRAVQGLHLTVDRKLEINSRSEDLRVLFPTFPRESGLHDHSVSRVK